LAKPDISGKNVNCASMKGTVVIKPIFQSLVAQIFLLPVLSAGFNGSVTPILQLPFDYELFTYPVTGDGSVYVCSRSSDVAHDGYLIEINASGTSRSLSKVLNSFIVWEPANYLSVYDNVLISPLFNGSYLAYNLENNEIKEIPNVFNSSTEWIMPGATLYNERI